MFQILSTVYAEGLCVMCRGLTCIINLALEKTSGNLFYLAPHETDKKKSEDLGGNKELSRIKL